MPIDPRLMASRKFPNISSASGLAFNSFRYMIGNPSRVSRHLDQMCPDESLTDSQFVHHDLHGKKPVAGFIGEISSKTMLKVTNIVIETCRARAALNNGDAQEIFQFFRNTVSADFERMKYKKHPHKPPVDIKVCGLQLQEECKGTS